MLKVEDLEIGSIVIGKSKQKYKVLSISPHSVVCLSEYSHTQSNGVSGQSTFPIALLESLFELQDKDEDTKQWLRGETEPDQ